MNTLSWMIYASDICQSVADTCGIIVVFGLIIGVVCWCFAFMHADGLDRDEAKRVREKGSRLLRLAIVIAVPAAIIGTFMPGQKTVLMIAASEAGQRVYNDPTNQPVITALREAITAKLKDVDK